MIMDTKVLNSLIGKNITVVTNTGNELWIFIENNAELRISNNTNMWRFTKENDVLLSSADFYIPMYDAYDENPFSPVYDSADYEPNEEEIDFPDKYYEDLEEYRDKRFKTVQNCLEEATISEVLENEVGDLFLTLSNGIVLSVYKTLSVGKKSNYKLLIK